MTQTVATKVGASAVKLGHGLSLKAAREWGLYIAIAKDYPARDEFTGDV